MSKPRESKRVIPKKRNRGDNGPSRTLVDRIADELRERVIDGTFQPGAPLQQAALSKRMGVSSIPFREAIRMLESEGFVEVLPFKGARVKGLSAEEIAERAKIAFALESHALEQALPTLTEEDLDRAGELADRIFPVVDVKMWNERMTQLLRILLGAERWPVLFDLIMRNRMAARRYTEILVRRTIEDPKWASEWAAGYFPRIVELLRRKDLEAVKSLQRRRFEEYVAQLLPWLAAGTGPSRPKRGDLRHLKKIQSTRGRTTNQSPTTKG